jgi:hypothetical protein
MRIIITSSSISLIFCITVAIVNKMSSSLPEVPKKNSHGNSNKNSTHKCVGAFLVCTKSVIVVWRKRKSQQCSRETCQALPDFFEGL